MVPKYYNQNPVPLFGSYVDPFGDRRGKGATRPAEPLPQYKPDFHHSFQENQLYFSWLGHSSVFLCIGGKTVLIDPVLSNRTSPVCFVGPKRFPGRVLQPKDLPEIDFLLLTHSHYDHMDKDTIKRLLPQVRHFVVPLGVDRILYRFGIPKDRVTALRWNETWHKEGIAITCLPSQHDSGRSPFDRDQTLWCSFLLTDGRFTVFDTGDGGFAEHFSQIHEKYGDIDLAIMECGQYNTRWHAIHMFPEESVEAAKILHAKLAIPVHWGAYVLSDHPWDDPPKRFSRRAEEMGVRYRIPTLYKLEIIEREKET